MHIKPIDSSRMLQITHVTPRIAIMTITVVPVVCAWCWLRASLTEAFVLPRQVLGLAFTLHRDSFLLFAYSRLQELSSCLVLPKSGVLIFTPVSRKKQNLTSPMENSFTLLYIL